MNWIKVKLPDVLFFQEGPGVRNHQFTNSGVKLLNVGNINEGKVDLTTTKIYISESEAFGKYKHFLVDEGDLIIASSGIVVDNFHNKIGFIAKQHLPLCMNTSTIRFKTLDSKVLDIKYFYYYLQTKYFTNQIRKLITGSAQLNFGPSHLKQVDLILPPLPTQKKIVAILDKADSLRQKDKQLLEHYNKLAQSIFHDMFGDPVRNEKGWDKVRLGTLGEWKSGGTPSREKENRYFNGSFPWVSSGELNQVYIADTKEKITDEAIKESNAKLIEPGAILLGMYDTAGLKSSINTVPLACNQAIAYSHLNNEKTDTLFVYFQIQLAKDFLKSQQRGVRQKNFNLSMIKDIEIISPPLKAQERFGKAFGRLLSNVQLTSRQDQFATHLFQTLLQKAFKGELVKES